MSDARDQILDAVDLVLKLRRKAERDAINAILRSGNPPTVPHSIATALEARLGLLEQEGAGDE